MGFVMNLCDRVCAINFGRFLAMDTPANIQKNKAVQEAYLGGDEE
jgi:branched-chain amino acid transport system ATP-binding protein